jgi:hypothetical protein
MNHPIDHLAAGLLLVKQTILRWLGHEPVDHPARQVRG